MSENIEQIMDLNDELAEKDKEIERLNNDFTTLKLLQQKHLEEIERLHSIIKEARKCINYYAIEEEDYSKIYSIEERAILKILDKVEWNE